MAVAGCSRGVGPEGGGRRENSGGSAMSRRSRHYNPLLGRRVISKALGIDRRMERWSEQWMNEENKR